MRRPVERSTRRTPPMPSSIAIQRPSGESSTWLLGWLEPSCTTNVTDARSSARGGVGPGHAAGAAAAPFPDDAGSAGAPPHAASSAAVSETRDAIEAARIGAGYPGAVRAAPSPPRDGAHDQPAGHELALLARGEPHGAAAAGHEVGQR